VTRPTSENVERLRKAFQEAHSDDPNIQDIRTEDLLGDYPAVRMLVIVSFSSRLAPAV
jgi:hypothetical protein